MKLFGSRELKEALAHAAAGGQALHIHRFIGDAGKAPAVFLNAVRRGESIAHLFDTDAARLARTARELGVRVIKLGREGTPSQHIDLVGKPLRTAIVRCRDDD